MKKRKIKLKKREKIKVNFSTGGGWFAWEQGATLVRKK